MRRPLLGASLVVVMLVGLTLTNGTAGRVETTKRSPDAPAARPADADQIWAANPNEAAAAEGDTVSSEMAADDRRSEAPARAATEGDDTESSTSSSSSSSEGSSDEALTPQTGGEGDDAEPETKGSDDTEAADQSVGPDAEAADGAAEDDDTVAVAARVDDVDESASVEGDPVDFGDDDSASFATSSSDNDALTTTETSEAVASATTIPTTTTATPTTTTTAPATTTTRRPTTTNGDDPTAALANAIHSERVTTSTSPARAESASQPFLTVYGPDGLPQLQPLPTDPYAATPDIRLGSIRIPAIGLDHSLHQGMTLTALDRGPSQWPGSAMPGQVGNMVIGGHRTTRTRPFRNLDDLDKGDEVIVTDDQGVDWTYEVLVVEIVAPDAIHIATQTPEPTATLFACHPPGSARQRIVVKLGLA